MKPTNIDVEFDYFGYSYVVTTDNFVFQQNYRGGWNRTSPHTITEKPEQFNPSFLISYKMAKAKKNIHPVELY